MPNFLTAHLWGEPVETRRFPRAMEDGKRFHVMTPSYQISEQAQLHSLFLFQHQIDDMWPWQMPWSPAKKAILKALKHPPRNYSKNVKMSQRQSWQRRTLSLCGLERDGHPLISLCISLRMLTALQHSKHQVLSPHSLSLKRKCFKTQLPVQPVMKILSRWRHSFSVYLGRWTGDPGTHFTNDFSITMQIGRNFN